MGYREAIEDNIRIYKNSRTSSNHYYPRCQYCDKEVMSLSYIRGNNYTCKGCKVENYLSDKENRQESNKAVKEKKLINAIDRIAKHTNDIDKYDRAIRIIKSYLHRDGWFDSTEEIMVAIELCKRKVKFNHQVEFGRYRVDFLLPEQKIILEVDGTLFHTEKTREKEMIRDNLIVLNLGAEWEVIRITDDDINSNVTKLIPALKRVKEKRQKLREKNDGLLPDWYSNKSI